MQILRACGIVILVSAVLALTAGADGQEPEAFSSRSELVVLNVVVTDRAGRPVPGLQQDAFTVLEDLRPQTLAFFSEMDTPVSIGLLVDASGSMRRNQDQIAAAVQAFAEAGHPDDEFAALAFNQQVMLMTSSGGSIFTRDPSILRDALGAGLPLRGRTALYDALLEGLRVVSRGQHERKVVVVLSDGGDNASVHSFDDTLRRVEVSQLMVYAVSIVDRDAQDANPKRLEKLARATGGLAFKPSGISDVGNALAKINTDIRSGYTLAFTPADDPRANRRRQLRVFARAPQGARYVVRARATYVPEARD